MSATILDGKKVSAEIRDELKPRVEHLSRTHRPPGLAVILVGNDPASEIYVRNKVKACAEAGIRSFQSTPPASLSTEELLALVESYNSNTEVDGILVQVPLPPQIDAQRILLAVDPAKDADGFHPLNLGNLVANRPGPRSCTPAGIMEMLRRYEVPLVGRHAVVVGRSDIVGKPMALLLLHANCTVTVCHSRTRDLAHECSRADILVAAMGKPALIDKSFIHEGAVVIDVGINRITDPAEAQRLFSHDPARLQAFSKSGRIVVGDVDPLSMTERASAYTPVPGGVGPLTIAMLLSNTVSLAERHLLS
jgi:methylenetetrahydrofolate dehydrogenase (NADP+) / methenyltetrahydrofolate cyclohydrolase